MIEPLGVSIIIPNYNNVRVFAEAIDSALNQEHPICEMIVVDDGSIDSSRVTICAVRRSNPTQPFDGRRMRVESYAKIPATAA
jgi:cellulose synthase/poly-beta-1,6-N-acetylglucosamine synthase-like glycosyltransferase